MSKKKEIKIVREDNTNYTFLEEGGSDISKALNDDKVNKNTSKLEKDILKTRSIDSKKLKIRHKDSIIGGQNQQGHSPVYE